VASLQLGIKPAHNPFGSLEDEEGHHHNVSGLTDSQRTPAASAVNILTAAGAEERGGLVTATRCAVCLTD
jgi:hypothetical protein